MPSSEMTSVPLSKNACSWQEVGWKLPRIRVWKSGVGRNETVCCEAESGGKDAGQHQQGTYDPVERLTVLHLADCTQVRTSYEIINAPDENLSISTRDVTRFSSWSVAHWRNVRSKPLLRPSRRLAWITLQCPSGRCGQRWNIFGPRGDHDSFLLGKVSIPVDQISEWITFG